MIACVEKHLKSMDTNRMESLKPVSSNFFTES